ncbi:helix-turn-helix transcriptional regulator [Paraburkholderia sp. RL17-337-BIB-A]|uniref:helix-turn-helix transcriptional regulator n=1 Tax=Paraburkholderia sp. RL17-337-BIB-A TaxID=3031636 RepID=UPI0038BB310D
MEHQLISGALHRLPSVTRLTGLCKSSIYALIRDGEFPSPVRIGRRAVAWRQRDLEKWVGSRIPTLRDLSANGEEEQ